MSLNAAADTGDDDATIGEATERTRWGRIASAMVGCGLLLFGLKKRSLSRSIAAVTGGWLLYRGISGKGRPVLEYGTDIVTDRDRLELDAAPAEVERSITIGKSPAELYQLWLEPETLERIMGYGGKIVTDDDDDGWWTWTVPGPLERTVTWETEIVEEQPDELLRWKSPQDESISTEGSVAFRPAPGDQGTEVTLQLQFDSPGGALGNEVVRRIGFVPSTLARKSLHRFKSLAETGEIPTLDRNPSGRGSGDLV